MEDYDVLAEVKQPRHWTNGETSPRQSGDLKSGFFSPTFKVMFPRFFK